MRRRIRGGALLKLLERLLRDGAVIELEGQGAFRLNADGQIEFEANQRKTVFIAYADEDRAAARRLSSALRDAGFEPWLDKEKLLPGQNWPRAIERAIELSDYFAGCFSRRSVAKRGHFQSELRYALEAAARLPMEDIFLIPLRLDECEVPHDIKRTIQHVDLFPDWQTGVEKLMQTLRSGGKESN